MASPPQDVVNFRERLQDFFKSKGWSVAAAAKEAGVSYSTMRSILGLDRAAAGSYGPSFTLVHSIVHNLHDHGLSADWLLTGREPVTYSSSDEVKHQEEEEEEGDRDREVRRMAQITWEEFKGALEAEIRAAEAVEGYQRLIMTTWLQCEHVREVVEQGLKKKKMRSSEGLTRK